MRKRFVYDPFSESGDEGLRRWENGKTDQTR